MTARLAGSPASGLLLERGRELAALRAAIGEAVGGRARVVLVEGSAGIGKTRLSCEARRLVGDADIRVLAARGGELEREFAFGVVRQLFESRVAGDASLLRGAATSACGVFEPGEGAADGFGDDPSFALLHGLYRLAVNAGGGCPAVNHGRRSSLVRRPSLRFLGILVRRLEGLPLLVIGSVRPSERRGDSALLGEVAGDPLTVSVRPGPLRERAAIRLVRGRLGHDADEAFAIACHATTGGNPLWLQELLRALAAEGVQPCAAHADPPTQLGPRAASRAVLVRLARLPEGAVRIARAGAVLVSAEIVRPEPALVFVHPPVRAVVYEDMPVPSVSFSTSARPGCSRAQVPRPSTWRPTFWRVRLAAGHG